MRIYLGLLLSVLIALEQATRFKSGGLNEE